LVFHTYLSQYWILVLRGNGFTDCILASDGRKNLCN